MSIDTHVPRTRRALLAGAMGGLGLLLARAVGRPELAAAATGGNVILGQANTADAETRIDNTKSYGTGFFASGKTVGVYGNGAGMAGVFGYSAQGAGVFGRGFTQSGVGAQSDTYYGIAASSDAADRAGIFGRSNGGSTGVHGVSGSTPDGPWPPSPTKTGVYGYAAGDASANGVYGRSTSGRGVRGTATSGIGVRGYATSGTGGSFEATSGVALRAVGRVKLDNCAGVATIAAGASSKTVSPGIDLTSSSAVVATLNGNAGSNTVVKRVAVNATADTFTIHLTADATANVKVAWVVIG